MSDLIVIAIMIIIIIIVTIIIIIIIIIKSDKTTDLLNSLRIEEGKILLSYFSLPLNKPIFPFWVIFTIKLMG